MFFDGPDHGEMDPQNRAKMLRARRVLERAARRGPNPGREHYRNQAAALTLLGAPRMHTPPPEPDEKVVKRRQSNWQRKLNGALKQTEHWAAGCTEREIARRMGQTAASYANRGRG